MDGGGGTPADQTVTQTAELPEWAKPYAKETLAKTQALTSEPYQTYGGERIAGFTPAQTQTQEKIMDMGIAPQMGMATGVTGAGGLASLGAGAQYGAMATTPGLMQAYMSPYMQNVVDIQQREAQRQADIARTGRGAQAVRAGAFGGSRQAIMEAEAGRNLQQQLGDIQARGLQSAYDQARQAQQFQAELGLRGAGQAAQAGQVLGQLGATQFGQEKDILQAQLGVGEQQRAMQQSGLDLAYQDFLNQQKYPYQQLGFMADMIRGVPVGQTAQTIYQSPAPDPFSQAAGLAGTAYYGSKIFGAAEGGSVPGYAMGGISGLNPVEREAALDNMGDKQMQGLMGLADISQLAKLQVAEKLQQNAQIRKAAEMAQAGQQPQPQTTVAEEALMAMGLGGLDVPEDMVSAADGGIIGYQTGGVPESGTVLTEEQRKKLRAGVYSDVKYHDPAKPQTPTQEERDELALYMAERRGEKVPGADYGRPTYTPGTAPTPTPFTPGVAPSFKAPYTAQDYMTMMEQARAPGMAQIEQGFAEEKAANEQQIQAIRDAEAQRRADVEAAGEYGTAQEKRAQERLAGMDKRREDAKLAFIRDVSTTLLTSPTRNFLSDLGVAVGRGGKSYDATVEKINTAKEKLQDSIDTIMEQRRGEKLANAKERRAADVALAKAQGDLAKLLAGKKTKFGEINMNAARDAVKEATSQQMAIAERSHAADVASFTAAEAGRRSFAERQDAAARAQYEAGERGRLEMAKPESREALQARIINMLASSDPKVRAIGRTLQKGAAGVTEAFTYKTPPGQVTPAIMFKSIGEIEKEVRAAASAFVMNPTEGMSKEAKERWIRDEIRRRFDENVKLYEAQMGIARGNSGAGAPTGGGVNTNNPLLK